MSKSPQIMFEDAIAQQRRDNHKGAVKRFKQVLKQAPDHPHILNQYAYSLAELGELSNARKILEKAIKSNPDHADSWNNLGAILEKDGNLDAVADAYTQFCKLMPDSSGGHARFADACQQLERYGDALIAYERALTIDPDDPSAWHGLSRVCMFEGNWSRALEAVDRALQHYPGMTLLLGIKSVACAELGRKTEVDELVDFERFIEVKSLSAPDGYGDLESFNNALAAHSQTHPSLVYEPSGSSTVTGHQTSSFLEDEDLGPIASLYEMIDEAVRDYRKSHPIDPSHLFLSQMPQRWEYNIWATILGSQGHQSAHIHPNGWLSGVYYPRLPDVISANSETQSGWIEFGRAAKYPKAKAEHTARSYQPYEGMLVMFPSYFYHRTVPFESKDSNDKRISIAFDVMPVT